MYCPCLNRFSSLYKKISYICLQIKQEITSKQKIPRHNQHQSTSAVTLFSVKLDMILMISACLHSPVPPPGWRTPLERSPKAASEKSTGKSTTTPGQLLRKSPNI